MWSVATVASQLRSVLRVKLECIRLLTTLRLDTTKLKLISGFIDTYLRLDSRELQVYRADLERLTKSQQEGIMKIETSWELAGRQQGMILLLANQLSHRFKVKHRLADIRAMLSGLTTEQLESLGYAMFDFESLSDLEQWISKQAPHEEL
jgi:hypothetical protein